MKNKAPAQVATPSLADVPTQIETRSGAPTVETVRAAILSQFSGQPLAIDRRAIATLGDRMLAVPHAAKPTDSPMQNGDGGIAVISIDGPLMQRGFTYEGWFGEFTIAGYDTVLAAIESAVASQKVAGIILRINSPGGQAAGCFEAVRAIRSVLAASGKPCVAYADEMACSGAYALACAADQIVLPDSGCIGSVGVVQILTEFSKMLEQDGVSVAVITSGERKADGNRYEPLSGDARAAFQDEVDQLASVFAGEVALARKMTPKAVLALEAGVFIGAKAVSAGLADRVGSFADAVSVVSALAATRKPSGRTAARPTPGAKSMSIVPATILAALSLSEDATEADALASIVKTQSDQRASKETADKASAERDATRADHDRLLAAAGKKTTDEAVGAIEGFKSKAATADVLEAQAKQRTIEADKQARAALIEGGKASGKLTPVTIAKMNDEANNGKAAWSTAQIQSFLEVASPVMPTAQQIHKEPSTEKGMSDEWKNMSFVDRAALHQTDRARYDALKKASGE